jgi:catalase
LSEPAAFLVERQLGHFETVYPDYAAGVRAALAEQAKKAKAAKKNG